MAKTNKLPKKIAGVKIPKKVRKRGGKMMTALRHPLIADLAAAALIGAGVALRDNKKVRTGAKKAKRKAGEAAQGLGAGAASLATIIAAKAKEGADWMTENYESAGAGSNGSGSSGKGKSGGKKKSK